MALALGLPESWFTERCAEAIVTTRAINYDGAAGSPAPLPDQMRMGAHSDYGILTILLADPVPGLQICRGGEWYDIVPPPGTFVCNIGDMLARWTNDRWTSTLHRVVPPTRRAAARRRGGTLPRLSTRPRGGVHRVVYRRRQPAALSAGACR